MNRAVRQYRRGLRKAMKCCRSHKKRFLEKFDKALEPFLEDSPEPTLQQLEAAFGPAETMARSFMEELTEQDRKRYAVRKRIVVCVATAVILAVVTLAAIHIATKPGTIYVYDSIIDEGTFPAGEFSGDIIEEDIIEEDIIEEDIIEEDIIEEEIVATGTNMDG